MEKELKDISTEFYIYKTLELKNPDAKSLKTKSWKSKITADDIAWYLGERVEG